MVELLGEEWLSDHPPQTYGAGDWHGEGWDSVVDSELFFFWLLKELESSPEILTGLSRALYVLDQNLPSGYARNFILSDGQAMYAYRSSNTEDLHLAELESEWVVLSTVPDTGQIAAWSWEALANHELVVLEPGKPLTRFEEFPLYHLSAPAENWTLPESPELGAPYPNPCNAGAMIPFTLPQAGEVELRVMNLLGAAVWYRKLEVDRGPQRLFWDGRDRNGNLLPSGTFLIQIRTGGISRVRKLLLLR